MARAARWVVCFLGLLGASGEGALGFTGTLELEIGTLPGFVLPGARTVDVSRPFRFSFEGADFTTSITVPVPEAFPIVQLGLTGPAGLTRADFRPRQGPGGGFGGDAPLAGNARLGLFGPPPFAFLTVPLAAVGMEGASARAVSDLGVTITAFGGAWTTGTAQVLGTAGPLDGVTLASARGIDARTPLGEGQLVLVSPTLVRTNIASLVNLPVMARLTLSQLVPSVPEPGTALLLGLGVLGLGLRRLRRT